MEGDDNDVLERLGDHPSPQLPNVHGSCTKRTKSSSDTVL